MLASSLVTALKRAGAVGAAGARVTVGARKAAWKGKRKRGCIERFGDDGDAGRVVREEALDETKLVASDVEECRRGMKTLSKTRSDGSMIDELSKCLLRTVYRRSATGMRHPVAIRFVL